jgi:hypothetical protein
MPAAGQVAVVVLAGVGKKLAPRAKTVPSLLAVTVPT